MLNCTCSIPPAKISQTISCHDLASPVWTCVPRHLPNWLILQHLAQLSSPPLHVSVTEHPHLRLQPLGHLSLFLVREPPESASYFSLLTTEGIMSLNGCLLKIMLKQKPWHIWGKMHFCIVGVEPYVHSWLWVTLHLKAEWRSWD